jgi:hypothetical protein
MSGNNLTECKCAPKKTAENSPQPDYISRVTLLLAGSALAGTERPGGCSGILSMK